MKQSKEKNTEEKKKEAGAASIKYALIAGLVGFVIIGGAEFLGGQISCIKKVTDQQ